MKRTLLPRAIVAIILMASGAGTAETPLTVMTFNVRYGTANDGENSWDHRKDLVVNAIKAENPDLLGLQECLKFQADYIASQLPEYDHIGVGRESNGGGERMEIFYRPSVLIPLESGNFWLSETPNVPGSRSWNSANVRMATWAYFRHLNSGGTFSYLNSHLDHRSEEARAEASKMLARWADAASERGPVLITADFNATAEQSVPWKTLTHSLRDAWIIAGEQIGPPVTWSAFQAPSNEIRRIDWILVSKNVSVSQCKTVTYNESGRYPSDHFPVVAHVQPSFEP